MSLYTPIIVTPLVPAGSAVTLVMPESVEQTANTVTFEIVDPLGANAAPVDLEALLSLLVTGSPERIQQDTRRDGLRQVQADPPARLVSVDWQEFEHYGDTAQSRSAIGALTIAARRYDRDGLRYTLLLYRAEAIWTRMGVLEL